MIRPAANGAATGLHRHPPGPDAPPAPVWVLESAFETIKDIKPDLMVRPRTNPTVFASFRSDRMLTQLCAQHLFPIRWEGRKW